MQAIVDEAQKAGSAHAGRRHRCLERGQHRAAQLASGFRCCGTVREAGFKFGRWLDLEFWQLILPTPEQPVDG